jgi:hypothetical protein
MRRCILVALSLNLSGCGLAQQAQLRSQYEQSSAVMQRELAECNRRYPKRVKGQAADALRCSNAAFERNARSVPGNNADLVTLAGAKAVAAAERFDNGQITEAQLDVELATIHTEFAGGTQSRTNQGIMANAAAQQAAAARQQAAMQSVAAGAAIMAPPAPTTTNCSVFGNTMNCKSY